MKASESIDGGCSCGMVRYRLLDRPLIVHCCHCSWCQRESGAAFVLNALIEDDLVEMLAGEPVSNTIPSASGSGQEVSSCPHCDTALWSRYALPQVGDQILFVRVGTVDEPRNLPPDVHIFLASKVSWLEPSAAVPGFGRYYNYRAIWPAQSLTRREALRRNVD